jgi:hypothetical protein
MGSPFSPSDPPRGGSIVNAGYRGAPILGKGPKVRDKASYIRIRFWTPPWGGSKIGNIERQHLKCWTRRGRKERIHLGTLRT